MTTHNPGVATDTLAERYVQEVARRLPEKQRKDITDELRTTIADMVDGRPEARAAEAEHAVLAELGDPALLAAQYRDRPMYLIGPELFPAYWNLLKLLLTIVTPIVAAAVLLAELLSQATIGAAIGSAVVAAIQVPAHIGFWVTVVFAVIERTSGGHDVDLGEGKWTPDKLPERAKSTQIGLGELIGGLAVIVVTVAFLVWQRYSFPVKTEAGDRVPLLDPELWNGWMYVIFAILAVTAVVEVLKFREGRWTYPLALANGAVNFGFLLVVGWLAVQERLVNQEFLDVVAAHTDVERGSNTETWFTVNGWIIVVVIGALMVWDTVEGLVKARQAQALTK